LGGATDLVVSRPDFDPAVWYAAAALPSAVFPLIGASLSRSCNSCALLGVVGLFLAIGAIGKLIPSLRHLQKPVFLIAVDDLLGKRQALSRIFTVLLWRHLHLPRGHLA
jgi:hypothetical protein